jgi:endonuclease IV
LEPIDPSSIALAKTQRYKGATQTRLGDTPVDENPKALIGPAAFAFSTFTSDTVVDYVATALRAEKLGAAELLCLTNVLGQPRGGSPGYPSRERAAKIGEKLQEIQLSIHGPYAISLTTDDAGRLRNTRAHMTLCLRLADAVGATHVTLHAGSRQGGRVTQERVRQRLQEIAHKCDEDGISAVPAPEVAGKIASFGSFEEICAIAGAADCLFCWDVAHDYARGGDVTAEAGLLRRLELIERHIDLDRWRLPVHLSGIIVGRRGEVQHAPLDGGSEVPWRLFLSVLREQHFLDKVTIICESKAPDRDDFGWRVEEALKLQRFVDSGAIEKQYQPSGRLLTSYLTEGTDEEEE